MVRVATVAALLALAAPPAFASAAAPSVLNAGSSGEWLESLTAVDNGEDDDDSPVQVTLLVKHDRGRQVTGLLVDDDYDGVDETAAATVDSLASLGATVDRPVVAGGYGSTRIRASVPVKDSDDGISCGINGPRSSAKPLRIRARLDDGTETATVTSTLGFQAGYQCLLTNDPPFLTNATQSATSVDRGGAATFTVTADDPDGTSPEHTWGGFRYRLRRLSDGAIVTPPDNEFCSPGDNLQKSFPVTFPRRGRWVVEVSLLNEEAGGCIATSYSTAWWKAGAVDVNSSPAAGPSLSLTATRPQQDGVATITASAADAPEDVPDGGVVQDVEWNLDGNDSFEVVHLGRPSLGVSPGGPPDGALTATIDTAGKAPGLYTVAARVRDSGALAGTDPTARVVPAEVTYRVNAPPVAGAATVATWAGQAAELVLPGSDADGDALAYEIVAGPDHGTLTGAGRDRTYTPAAGSTGGDAVTYRVRDDYGGSDTETVPLTVHPATSITSGPPPVTGQTAATLAFSAPGAAATQCALDDDPWTPCTSPYLAGGLTDGEHTLRVRALDGAAVEARPAERTWRVDTTPPSTVVTGPPSLTNATAARFALTSEPGSTFRCRLDAAAAFTACDAEPEIDGLAEGVHVLRVLATDAAGNVQPAPESFTWRVDLTAPGATAIAGGPAELTSSPTATFELAGAEPGVAFECRLDGASFTPCDAAPTFPGLDDGPHVLDVRARDAAGNAEEPPVTRRWTVDTLAPAVRIDAGPAQGARTRATSASFEQSSPEDGAVLECRLDGAPFRVCGVAHELRDLPDGAHTFEVRGRDRAGNVTAAPAARTWTVDTTAPVTAISGLPPLTSSRDATAVLDAAEPGATFECRLDALPWASCASPAAFGGLGEGAHTLRVRATDAVGNVESPPALRSWTVDATGPEASLSAPPATTRATVHTFVLGAGEPGATLECRVDGGAWTPCASPWTTGELTDGEHVAELRATDEAGNTGAAVARTWTIDTIAAATTIAGPSGPTSEDHATFSFSAPGAAGFECRLDGGAWAACASPHTTRELGDGPHDLAVRASDAAGNVESPPAVARWVVATAAPRTSVAGGPDALTNATTARFSLRSSSPGGTFECRLDGAAFAPCSAEVELTGLAEGAHAFAVRAIDGSGRADPSPVVREWSVDITPPDTTITRRDDPLRFELGGGDGYHCSLDGGAWRGCPAIWTPSPLVPGEHVAEGRAVDAAGNVDPSPARTSLTIAGSGRPALTPDPPAPGGSGPACGSPAGCDPSGPTVTARSARAGGREALSIVAAGGGAGALRSLRLTLAKGDSVRWPASRRRAKVGAIELRDATGKRLRRMTLTAPARPKREAVVATAAGIRVRLRSGKAPRVTLSGLPAATAAVTVTLSFGKGTATHAPAGCRPGGTALLGTGAKTVTAPIACAARGKR